MVNPYYVVHVLKLENFMLISFFLFVLQVSIYSIWFYDKNDCHRIAKLMAE